MLFSLSLLGIEFYHRQDNKTQYESSFLPSWDIEQQGSLQWDNAPSCNCCIDLNEFLKYNPSGIEAFSFTPIYPRPWITLCWQIVQDPSYFYILFLCLIETNLSVCTLYLCVMKFRSGIMSRNHIMHWCCNKMHPCFVVLMSWELSNSFESIKLDVKKIVIQRCYSSLRLLILVFSL